jgi:hypothetical protein
VSEPWGESAVGWRGRFPSDASGVGDEGERTHSLPCAVAGGTVSERVVLEP